MKEGVGKVITGTITTGKTVGIRDLRSEGSKRWKIDIVAASMIGYVVVPSTECRAVADICKFRHGVGKVIVELGRFFGSKIP